MQSVILTGGSGFLGSNILLDLLSVREVPPTIHCLVRGNENACAHARLLAALNLARQSRSLAQVDALPSNVQVIDKDLCAVTSDDFHAVPARAVMIHSAAMLSFDPKDRETVEKTNIDGLKRLLDCFDEKDLQRFVFVSTAFNCGTSVGEIQEHLHATDGDFNNDYERSKAIGEHHLKQWGEARHIDVSIVRPSIIMGHSSTYHPGSSNDSYYGLVVRLAKLARIATPDQLPVRFDCVPDTLVDLIPVDAVSNTVVEEVWDKQSGFKITHAVSGSLSRVDDLLNAINACMGRQIVQPGAFDPAELKGIELAVNQSSAIYKPYMRQSKAFMRRPGSKVIDVAKMVKPWITRFLEVRSLHVTADRVQAQGAKHE